MQIEKFCNKITLKYNLSKRQSTDVDLWAGRQAA